MTIPFRCNIAPALSAAALALVTSAASAQDERRARNPNASAASATAETRAFGGLIAPNARMAGFFAAGGAPRRTKRVQSIQRIDTGVYCIRPQASTNITVSNSMVIVSTEYSTSDLDEVKVQWAASSSGCGNGRFGIYTLADSNRDGIYSFSNLVGFSVLVP